MLFRLKCSAVSQQQINYASTCRIRPLRKTPESSRNWRGRAIEIKGSWMKVEMFEANEETEKIDKKTGWILWRNEKEPLIKFNLIGC